MRKKLLSWNEQYLPKVLEFTGRLKGMEGSLPYIIGQDEYNQILKINSVFSSNPKFLPIDRTLSTKLPFDVWVPRPWQVPTKQLTLAEAMAARVKELSKFNCKINILWSGGTDSTSIVTAFLKNSPDRKQLRILYSPWSTYEHPKYVKFLKKFNVELVDISGERYLDWNFDGMFITGDGGDELMASIDDSFLKTHGWDSLFRPWKDFFYEKYPDNNFIEFCSEHFSKSGRDIDTVLDARWWFYTSCKSRSILNQKYSLLLGRNNFELDDVIGFFDSKDFESYIYWNITDCMPAPEYSSWKQPLKKYICEFDKFADWANNKEKTHSTQVLLYTAKKIALQNQYWIAMFTDGTVASTPSLPVLTKLEYNKYTNLDWVFND